MADDWFSGLLGSGTSDLYGGLLTEKQRKALLFKEIGGGLDEISRRAAEAGKPSLMPGGKGWLGSALSGYGAGASAAGEGVLKTLGDVQKIKAARRQQKLLEELDPIQRELLRRQLGGGSPGAPPAGVTPAPPGMPAAPLTPAAPPGATPTAAGPAGVPAPPAPPVSMGLPQAGMSPFGLPDAAPTLSGGPPTQAERLEWAKTVGPGGPYLPIEDWVAKQRAGQKQTGLLGDGSPYAQLASFPGPGPLGGSGGGGYGDDPFAGAGALAAAGGDEPTGGPDVVIPSGPRLQRSDLTNVAATGSDDWQRVKPLIRKYESGGRNIEQGVVGPQGGYNPSTGTVTGPSSASGYYQMIDPTWRAAARKAGIDTDKYPRAINAPEELQDRAAEALYREQGLKPWAPYNSRLAAATGYQGGGQDTVIPSGRGIPASALTTVADTTPGGGAPRGGGGVIPGLGITPEALATLNSMYKAAGVDAPFGSLLETYYKSPGYLGEKTRIEQQATKDVALEMDPKIEAEKARQTQKYIQENEAHKSNLALVNELIGKGVYFDPVTKTMKPITNAAEAMAAIDAAKPTGDIKEYEYYRKQELAAGQIPDPFQKWDASRRKASATTINTAEGFDAAQTKARVGVDAKIAQDLAEQAITGRRLMPVLDELAYLADKTPEGWKGPLAITTGRTLAGFGIAVPPGASNAEAFQALAQRLVPVVREPGATSQGEMNLYLNAGPSLAGTADGRRLIIDINRSMIQRSQEIAKVYRENIGKPDLYEKLAELDKPLFSPEQRAAMEGASRARAAAPAATPGGAAAPTGGGRPVAIGPNGEKLVLSPDGKQWVPQ